MTGFVAVAGDEDVVRGASERVRACKSEEDLYLDRVVEDKALHVFATRDLGISARRDLTIVCDGVGDGFEHQSESVDAQRSALSVRLLQMFEADASTSTLDLHEHHYVAWNARTRELWAGRDALGVKPLFVHQGAQVVVIASSQRLIARALADRGPIDRDSVVRFAFGEPPKPLRTYFERTRSLAPGWRLTWSLDGLSEKRVLPEALADLPPCPDDVVRRFRDVLQLAILRRLGATLTTVTLLSGGLDSSAITEIASISRSEETARLRSLTLEFDPSRFSSESAFANMVGAPERLEQIKIVCTEPTLLEDADRQLREQGGLFLAPALYLGPSLYKEAHDLGATILLDGHGGDEAVSFGWGRLQELAEAGDWGKLSLELKHVAPQARQSARRTFLSFYLLYGPLSKATRFALRVERSLRRRLGCPRTDPRLKIVARDQRAPLQASLKKDRKEVASNGAPGAEFRRHMALVADSRQVSAFEILDAASSAMGVSARYPFWDRDLLRLCLSLPAKEKLDRGFGRLILRNALLELNPLVRWRRDKFDFSPVLAHALGACGAELLHLFLDAPPSSAIWTYFDKPTVAVLMRELNRLRDRTPGNVVQALWRFALASIWLEELELKK